jgi:hypothetical protein
MREVAAAGSFDTSSGIDFGRGAPGVPSRTNLSKLSTLARAFDGFAGLSGRSNSTSWRLRLMRSPTENARYSIVTKATVIMLKSPAAMTITVL